MVPWLPEDRDGWVEDVLYWCFESSEVDIAFVPTKRFKKLELTSEKHHFFCWILLHLSLRLSSSAGQ